MMGGEEGGAKFAPCPPPPLKETLVMCHHLFEGLEPICMSCTRFSAEFHSLAQLSFVHNLNYERGPLSAFLQFARTACLLYPSLHLMHAYVITNFQNS